ncbi:MAG TPA: carboxymuconolactone decarboxylase family protein [Pseudomonadales bacterium]
MPDAGDNQAGAWVTMPTEADLRARGASGGPYDFGFLPNMARLIATHPTIGPAFSALFGAIMFAPGALDRRERELVAGVAAAAQDCFY